jgi:peptidoglycan/LPS O-acetylase OafA/YrhL
MSLLRIYKSFAKAQAAQADAVSAIKAKGLSPADTPDPGQSYLVRLLRLIPAEIVAFHTTLVPLINKEMADDLCVGHSSLIVLAMALLIGLRAQLTRGQNPRTGPQWIAVAVSAVAYGLWAWHTNTGPFICISAQVYPVISLMVIAAYVIAVPWIYKGDDA